MEQSAFALIRDEYYRLRGWDVQTGLQTGVKMKELGLEDISRQLERLKLLKLDHDY
jgi:aldehyde:ferredoxin oxidoreductase